MSKTLEDSCRDLINEYGMIGQNEKIIVGTSGGADSVCLLFLLKKFSHEMGFDMTAVHVNHMIRGDEAQRDEQFVKDLCRQIGVECISVRANVPKLAQEKDLSIEEAGRMARYRAFDMVAERFNTNGPYRTGKVAVAHHRDDNVETILFNLIRGTDIKGLTGIAPVSRTKRLTVIRPLLGVDKKQIVEYLEANGISYTTDSTNSDEDFARNRLRNTIIPQMQQINSRAAEHIDDLAKILSKLSEYYDKNVTEAMETVVDLRDEAPAINVERLKYLDRAIQSGVVYNTIGAVAGTKKDIGRVHVEDVLSLCEKQTGRRMELPYGLEAVRSYSNIIIRKENRSDKETRADIESTPIMGLDAHFSISLKSIEEGKKTFALADGSLLSFEIVDVDDSNRKSLMTRNEYTKAFDRDKIKGTLILGRPQKDDKIRFSGGSKTLKKFFVDEKIPQELREDIPVLKDMEGVLWIMGYRIGQQYKITGETKRALVVSVSGGENGR